MIRAVAVYLSSTSDLDAKYVEAACQLGTALARERWALVYGGNNIGLMRTLADATRDAGGKVIGVTPRIMVDQNIHDTRCDELVVTESMRQRKQIMEDRADGFVAMPGGLGTLEELFEIIVGKQLNYHHKPIVILNIAGYYDPMIRMLEHGIEGRFIRPRARTLWHVSTQVAEAIEYLRAYTSPAAQQNWREAVAEASP